VDKTYVKVAGRWRYLYRAVDQNGQVIDVLLSEDRDTTAARRFFTRALAHGPAPVEVTTDKGGPYLRVLDEPAPAAAHVTEQHDNNPIESDQARLKARLRPMRGLNRCARPPESPPATPLSRTSAAATTSSPPRYLHRSAWPPHSPSSHRPCDPAPPRHPTWPRHARRNRPAFAGFRFPPEVITVAVRWYLRYGLSYRDVDELLAERGIEHVTVYRWVQRLTPLFTDAARALRHATGDRWFVDETYVKVAGRWRYLYRAVDQYGQVIDVMLSEQRDTAAARRFFTRALRYGPAPVEVTTDKAGPYLRVIDELVPAAAHVTQQYANNRAEADHARLKGRVPPSGVGPGPDGVPQRC
jgi:transposase, IS6 family